jgi:GNAT superfamily N-acetyltransferase
MGNTFGPKGLLIGKPNIRRIRADEGPLLRVLRLRALTEAPMAFGSTLAREQDYPDDLWRERAVGSSAGCDSATFVAERDGRWVGLATGLALAGDPQLVGMFVDSSARRLGVGVELVEAVASWARACGAARLKLWVATGNDAAAALYLRCGFRTTGVTQPISHTPTLAECEMIRELN